MSVSTNPFPTLFQCDKECCEVDHHPEAVILAACSHQHCKVQPNSLDSRFLILAVEMMKFHMNDALLTNNLNITKIMIRIQKKDPN